MTFLNPRPAAGSPGYPWRFDGQQKLIQLPLPLTYDELKEGSQIVVSGVTDAIAVIEGTVEGDLLVFRAGGLLIATVMDYEGAESFVDIDINQDFTGEILAVNFDKAYKNLPAEISVDGTYDSIVSYNNSSGIIAKCTLNSVVISERPNYIPSNGLLGNLIFQSQYIRDYGNVIESYYWTNGRYLYVLRLGDDYKMGAVNIESTNSPLLFPIL